MYHDAIYFETEYAFTTMSWSSSISFIFKSARFYVVQNTIAFVCICRSILSANIRILILFGRAHAQKSFFFCLSFLFCYQYLQIKSDQIQYLVALNIRKYFTIFIVFFQPFFRFWDGRCCLQNSRVACYCDGIVINSFVG